MKRIFNWIKKKRQAIENTVVVLVVISAPVMLILRAFGVNVPVTACLAPFAALSMLVGALVVLALFASLAAEALTRLTDRWN